METINTNEIRSAPRGSAPRDHREDNVNSHILAKSRIPWHRAFTTKRLWQVDSGTNVERARDTDEYGMKWMNSYFGHESRDLIHVIFMTRNAEYLLQT